MTELSVIEICAGAGGQALGLERAGFEHKLAVELDPTAAATIRLNRPEWKVEVGDVADLGVFNPSAFAPDAEGLDGRPIDLLAGGVPCPPFSIAGKQLGANDERDLFAWAVEQVAIIKPRALLLENVRGLSMPRFAGYRQHVLDRLREFGYSAEWRLIQASDFGVPQLRPRFVLVAMQTSDFEYFSWPEPTGEPPTVGETLLDLMQENGWDKAEEWARKANSIAPTIVGGSKKHGGADLGPTRAKRAWAELGVDAYGVHDTAPPYAKRPMTEYGPKLTVEMVARLQGWMYIRDSDSAGSSDRMNHEFAWRFTGGKTAQYRQIGNAFPPPVAKAIGSAIAAALRHESPRRERDLRPATDPIYIALRESSQFMSAAQISAASGLELDDPEIDRRISLLSRDFEIIKEECSSGLKYKLGAFRAFTGQDDHARHEYYRKNLSRVS
ncbi:DNA (cytosine-5-)-methyltransferase [Nocardia cyriacigeorgica]|uniref:Cytosine-specific methyltransferase n=1 Tax=Nocardia cyriacigeorgica TaxID=135487 RepID=A0A6P1CTU2_9NOCA|nr:DNA (cytosine-5-)-methyltransferase [Nocardia cyriacigeorgica]MBF6423978.1 DNA (cytosine-5-)-methyltransferase [Nocardia cyriacigeorgica]NEW35232.1 DNA (cytosine-5-)-methyltransferase [Nocardia cyriacigeorgica]